MNKLIEFKYGRNPYQKNAYACVSGDLEDLPFEVLNGKIGYNNTTDFLQGWPLVKELDKETGCPAAAFIKHSSPSGTAIGEELNETDRKAWNIKQKEPSELAVAAYKAWEADPKSAYGATAVFSRAMDKSAAKVLRAKNLDCIVAPGFEDDALRILEKKKNGRIALVSFDNDYEPFNVEAQEIYGVRLVQERNNIGINYEMFKDWNVPNRAKKDMILAGIATKYSLSNTITISYDGQVIGSGVGQQSRVDAVKIAGDKAKLWFMRRCKPVLDLEVPKELKRAERTHFILNYIEKKLSNEWKSDVCVWTEGLELCLWSDAFFPFRDGIDIAAKYGVKYICQPGGSIRDREVLEAAEDHRMNMFMSGIRLFNN